MQWRHGADAVEAWSLREVEVGDCYLQKTQSKVTTLRNLCQDRGGKPCPDPTPSDQVHSGLCLLGYFENYDALSPIHGELMRTSSCTGKKKGPLWGRNNLCLYKGQYPAVLIWKRETHPHLFLPC